MGSNMCGISSVQLPTTIPQVPSISPEIVEAIKNAANPLVTKIPLDYAEEHMRIVGKMKESSPEPYEKLLYSDYPDKNGSMVHALALKYATSEDMKKRTSDGINETIKPKLEEETAKMEPFVRKPFHKAVEKAIEQAIDKAVDAAIKQIKDKNNDNTQTKGKTS